MAKHTEGGVHITPKPLVCSTHNYVTVSTVVSVVYTGLPTREGQKS